MHSWMVCGSRRGTGIVRHREFLVVVAGLVWPAATPAPAATSWISRAAKPSRPGRPAAVTAAVRSCIAPPRLVRLSCACGRFMFLLLFVVWALVVHPLRSGCRFGGSQTRWRGADAVLDEH